MTANIGLRNPTVSLKEFTKRSELISTIGFRNVTATLKEIGESNELMKLKENV